MILGYMHPGSLTWCVVRADWGVEVQSRFGFRGNFRPWHDSINMVSSSSVVIKHDFNRHFFRLNRFIEFWCGTWCQNVSTTRNKSKWAIIARFSTVFFAPVRDSQWTAVEDWIASTTSLTGCSRSKIGRDCDDTIERSSGDASRNKIDKNVKWVSNPHGCLSTMRVTVVKRSRGDWLVTDLERFPERM